MAEIIRPAQGMWQTLEDRCTSLINIGGQVITRRSATTSPYEPNDGLLEVCAEWAEVEDNATGTTANSIVLSVRGGKTNTGEGEVGRIEAELDGKLAGGRITYSLPRPETIRNILYLIENCEINIQLPFRLEWLLEPIEHDTNLNREDTTVFSGFIEPFGAGTWLGSAVLELIEEKSKVTTVEKRLQREPKQDQPGMVFWQKETTQRWGHEKSSSRTVISYGGQLLEFELEGFEEAVIEEGQPPYTLLALERTPTMITYSPHLLDKGNDGPGASISHSQTFLRRQEDARNSIGQYLKKPSAHSLRLVNEALEQASDDMNVALLAAEIDGWGSSGL
ncbi:MAG TPA: hypothetical protein VH234_00630 [Candidatus Saccharimonadales bacterium]|jgi:hypothetical protein|nr:hypothetical protein [Candidatus Saccharimonadales bacterium]